MPPSAKSLANLRPITKETSAGLNRLRVESRLTVPTDPRLIDSANPPLSPDGSSVTVRRAWRAKDLDELYVQQAFPPRWRGVYIRRLKALRSQYIVPGTKSAQYEVLIQRIASLQTLAMILEAQRKAKDDDVILEYRSDKLDEQLKGYVAAIQKYTEAERRINIVQEEVVITTLTRVVSIAETVISDPAQRSAFLRALQSTVTDAPTVFDALPGPILPPDPDESLSLAAE